ncbi:FAD-dependent oxidoreductase [Janibacter sp. DB-40]|uniref:FAD-dependent oxidoreductase n=1 Tax=Janibacter sp. DB-40 TaxID=3028808 RepID=UPI002405F3F8|nr:FAD-dependent oxidoreductase [Janibacter sp. DB-40]
MTSVWLQDREPFPSDSLDGGRVQDVVVGAGITGLVTALLLARAGRQVVVLEARTPGAVTTGNSTAKVSLLQATRYSQLLGRHSEDVVRAYVEGNREGRDWLLRYCAEHDVGVLRRPAVTYASDDGEGLRRAKEEHEAARRLDLGVRWEHDLPVPFPTSGGTVLDDQAEVDPMALVDALVRDLRDHGGRVVTGTRVRGVTGTGQLTVQCRGGSSVVCDQLVLATGTPVLDRGLHFARLSPERSYALALEHPAPPEMMLISSHGPSRSLRDARAGDARLLLVGGEGHTVGRTDSERLHVDRLRRWTREHFPEATEVAHWSAQDYVSHDLLPVIDTMPGSSERIHVATGYGKWGMTNGVAAALATAARILDGRVPWAQRLQDRPVRAGAVRGFATINAGVVASGVRHAAGAALRPLDETPPSEGKGVVGRRGPVPTAVSTVDGRTCALSAVCTHLGGVVEWNDVEQSWDCSLHGSRFSHSGEVLEGPATRPLRPARGSD